MKKLLNLLLLFLATCIISGYKNSNKTTRSDKPNIIFILADDMGYGDPGCYNPQSKIPTSNIDRLASQGMRFTDAHAAAAWCVPSRYGFLTGRYPFRTKMNWRQRSIIDPGQPTVASLLKKRGYRTGMVGKWHQGFDNFIAWNQQGYRGALRGGPVDHGFDYYYGIPASLDIPPYFYIKNDHAVHPPTDTIEASYSKGVTAIQGAFWRPGKIAPGFVHSQVLPRLTHKALDFIGQHEREHRDQPFFLYFALTAPHTPWLPSKSFRGSSRAGAYGDFVVQVDDVIGQIMKKVQQEGIKNNTLFIFASDNGPVWFTKDVKHYDHRSTAMLRGMKIDSWEGGHRIPFIVRWPEKIKAGSKSDAMLDFTDMMATFAAVSGDTLQGKKNTPHDSYNQLPVWEGEKQEVRTVLPVAKTIRRGYWKLIMGSGLGSLHREYGKYKDPDTAKGELYNLQKDISEQHNQYNTYPGKVRQLEHLWKQTKHNQ